jgi:hypothetical protein
MESTERSPFTPLSRACLSLWGGLSRNLRLFLGFFVKRFCAEFNENPADSLVSGSQREERTDGRTDGRDFHIRRCFSWLCKERLRRKTRS